MQRRRFLTLATVGTAALAVMLTACGGSSGGGSGSSGAAKSGGSITVYNCKPENPLVPANTNESCGLLDMQDVFRGLVQLLDVPQPTNAMADSITPSDGSKVFDIKLKTGNTFQDGSPVNSDSFINAWNWAAYAPNGAINNTFFAPIAGYNDLNPAPPTGSTKAPTPTTKTMSGLKKISETEFTVTLSTPQSFFPIVVGYAGFDPMPPSFFTDPAAFGKKPIGNGPMKIDSGDGNAGFHESRWDGYKGADKPKIDSVFYKTYTTAEAGYADMQAGNMDFMNQVPTSSLVNDQYQKDFPSRYSNKPIAGIQTVTLPVYDPNYNDANLGKALSLAIDRASIVKAVFNGARQPATGWVAPGLVGYKPGACGQWCTFNPAMAKQYYAQAKFKGPYTLGYNADGDHKAWTEAVCNSIKNTLGAQCTAKPYVDFSTFRAAINAHKMTGMFRSGWTQDYPHIQDFLEPLYKTGGSANDGLYSNPQFDSLIDKANGETGDQALTDYQSAEALLASRMSVIPLWYYTVQAVWSTKLKNVVVDTSGNLDITHVTVG
jgi:oligopeptide transport system substrate-binding protein